MKVNLTIAYIFVALCFTLNSIQGQTTAFTYQGFLKAGGTNASGSYSANFKLYDAASGGSQIGPTVSTVISVTNGLFNASLDFGPNAFNSAARYLEIAIGGAPLT